MLVVFSIKDGEWIKLWLVEFEFNLGSCMRFFKLIIKVNRYLINMNYFW